MIRPEEKTELRRYLLGELSEANEGRVEQRLLSDDLYFTEHEMTEDDLISDYIRGTLSSDQRLLLESHFLVAPERQKKLAFAIALNEAALAHAAQKRKSSPIKPSPLFTRFLSATPFYLRVAAAVVIVLVSGVGLWLLLTRKSDVDKGLIALNEAYKQQRLVEARVSKLNYAPMRQLRANVPPEVSGPARDRAERLLLDAVFESPNSASYHALGRLYLAAGRLGEAQAQLEKAQAIDPNNDQLESDLGAVLLELGKSERSNDAGKSLQYFGQSLEHINRALELNKSLPEALFDRAILYQQMKLPSQAKDAWRKYLEQDGISPWAAEARRNLQALEIHDSNVGRERSGLYETFCRAFRNRDSDIAWTTIRQSRSRSGNQIVEQLLDEYLDAEVHGNTDDAAFRLQLLSFAGEVEVQNAGDHYTSDLTSNYSKLDLSRYRKLSDIRRLMKLANEQYNKSEFEAAVLLYAKANQQFAQVGDGCEALFAENWIGYCELRLADQKSLPRFQRLSDIFKERNYRSLEAQSLHAISDAQTSSDELSKALEYAGRSLNIAELIQDDATRLRCLQQFVSMNLMFANYVDSLKYGLQALEIAAKYSIEPKLLWTFYHQIALDFDSLNLPTAALEFEKEALRLAQASKWPFIIARTFTQMGIFCLHRGKYDEAVDNGLKAVAASWQVEGEKSRLNIAGHSLMKLGDIYRQAGKFDSALARYDEALQVFDKIDLGVFRYEAHKGKFLTLNRMGENTLAQDELLKVLPLFEQYRLKISEERNRDSFFDAGQDIYDLAIDFTYSKVGDSAKAFEYAEQSRARSLLDLMNTSPQVVNDGADPDLGRVPLLLPLSLDEIRNRLPDRVQILQYAILDDKLIIWVVSHSSIESRVMPISRGEFERKAASYLNLVAKGDAEDESVSTSKFLYETLISPIESLLDVDKQVCIVPDKILSKLPFAALISRETGKYFIEKFSLVVAPSSNVYLTCTGSARKKPTTSSEKILSVGNPSFSSKQFPDLRELPAAETEAEMVARLYGGTSLLRENARESRVRLKIDDAEVIHFASHYLIDSHSSMLSTLVLADEHQSPGQHSSDGALQVWEVYKMKLPRACLVVLSACQTGMDRTYQGEGSIGIARAFLSVGVPIVVASLWPVESDSTAELMVAFHRYRKLEGLSSADSLRQAQLDLIASHDRLKLQPNRWAAFVAFGGYTTF